MVQLALEDVAGSGMSRHHVFQDQVDAYHERFRSFFKTPVQDGLLLRPADLDALPQFSFEEEPFMDMAARVATGVGVLFLAVVFLLVLAGPSLRRVGRLAR